MSTRSLNSLQDAFRAIKELDETITGLTTRNLDFHQRQIKNAHPSIDDFDYVVRKELRDLIGGGKPAINITGGGAGNFYLRTFGYGVNRDLTTGTDLLPDLIIPFPSTTLLKIFAKCKVAPTGSDVIADINLLGSSILGGSFITIPAGSSSVITVNSFDVASFTEGQVLTFDLDQIGATISGQTLVVTMLFKKN